MRRNPFPAPRETQKGGSVQRVFLGSTLVTFLASLGILLLIELQLFTSI
jgi:hypothetical protein